MNLIDMAKRTWAALLSSNDLEHRWQARSKRHSFRVAARTRFYRAMAAYLEEGIPPHQALQQMYLVSRQRKRKRLLSRLYGDMLRRFHHTIDGRHSVSDAIGMFSPVTEQAMMMAGESSGTLVAALRELSDMLDRQLRITRTIRNALISSGALVCALTGNLYFILATVVPAASELISEQTMRHMMVAPYYIGLGQWLLAYGPPLTVGLGLLILASLASLPRWVAPIRDRLDNALPPWTAYRSVQATYFLAAVSAMVRAGMPFQTTLEELVRSANPWQRHHFRRMLHRLKHGKNEAQAMDSGLLPEDVADELSVYALLPSFGQAMSALARSIGAEFEEHIKKVAGKVQVSVLLIVALMLVFTLFALGEIGLTASAEVSRQSHAV